MRRHVCLGFLALACLVLAACDTDQPLVIDTQSIDITVEANNAQVPIYQVWDLIEDSDGDGMADDVDADGTEDVFLWCEDAGIGGADAVPWTYSVEISVLREGEIVPVVLTSDIAKSDTGNRSVYDSLVGNNTTSRQNVNLVHDRGRCSGNADIKCNPASTSMWCQENDAGFCELVFTCTGDDDTTCNPGNPGGFCQAAGAGVCTAEGVCSGNPAIACLPTCDELGLGSCVNEEEFRTFKFLSTNRRRLSRANRELLSADDNIIGQTCLGDPICEDEVLSDLQITLDPVLAICPGQDLGDPEIDPQNNPNKGTEDATTFPVVLDKGDTVLVKARRSNELPGGGVVIPFIQNPGLRARIFVNGSILQADEVSGNLVSDPEDTSPNVSFSFTSK